MLKYQNKLYPNAKTFKCYAKIENIIELYYSSLQITRLLIAKVVWRREDARQIRIAKNTTGETPGFVATGYIAR